MLHQLLLLLSFAPDCKAQSLTVPEGNLGTPSKTITEVFQSVSGTVLFLTALLDSESQPPLQASTNTSLILSSTTSTTQSTTSIPIVQSPSFSTPPAISSPTLSSIVTTTSVTSRSFTTTSSAAILSTAISSTAISSKTVSSKTASSTAVSSTIASLRPLLTTNRPSASSVLASTQITTSTSPKISSITSVPTPSSTTSASSSTSKTKDGAAGFIGQQTGELFSLLSALIPRAVAAPAETQYSKRATSASSTSFISSATPTVGDKSLTNAGAFKTDILAAINTVRTLHNASALKWNDTLTSYATDRSQTCQLGLTTFDASFGENVALSKTNASAAVQSWIPAALANLSFSFSSSFSGSSASVSASASTSLNLGDITDLGELLVTLSKVPQFTQLVWKSSTQVGCGRSFCNNRGGWIVVCDFTPKGNKLGSYESNVQGVVARKGDKDGEIGKNGASRRVGGNLFALAIIGLVLMNV